MAEGLVLRVQAVAVALYNPEKFKTMGAARLDVGQVLPETMTDQCYRELLVSPFAQFPKILHNAHMFSMSAPYLPPLLLASQVRVAGHTQPPLPACNISSQL